MKNFIQLCLGGEISLDRATIVVDDFVDIWHGGSTNCELSEFLGFTQDEYREWVTNPNAVCAILAKRAIAENQVLKGVIQDWGMEGFVCVCNVVGWESCQLCDGDVKEIKGCDCNESI